MASLGAKLVLAKQLIVAGQPERAEVQLRDLISIKAALAATDPPPTPGLPRLPPDALLEDETVLATLLERGGDSQGAEVL